MQKYTGTEYIDNYPRPFDYFAESNNKSSPEFSLALNESAQQLYGIIAILTAKFLYWSVETSSHKALISHVRQQSLARIESRPEQRIDVWAEQKPHLKQAAIYLSLQKLEPNLKLRLFTVSSYDLAQNSSMYFFDTFTKLPQSISRIK